MKAVFFTLTLALSSALAPAAQTPAPSHAKTAARTERALVIQLTIPAPLPEVWKAFTTPEGLRTWLAPDVTVNLRPGGDWIVHFPGSTGGGTIVSFVPQKELVIAALCPDKFPTVRAQRTHAVFTFEPAGNATVVRLTQTGWKDGPEWTAAYEYLSAGNAQLMAALHHRFAYGPVDWSKQ